MVYDKFIPKIITDFVREQKEINKLPFKWQNPKWRPSLCGTPIIDYPMLFKSFLFILINHYGFYVRAFRIHKKRNWPRKRNCSCPVTIVLALKHVFVFYSVPRTSRNNITRIRMYVCIYSYTVTYILEILRGRFFLWRTNCLQQLLRLVLIENSDKKN